MASWIIGEYVNHLHYKQINTTEIEFMNAQPQIKVLFYW